MKISRRFSQSTLRADFASAKSGINIPLSPKAQIIPKLNTGESVGKHIMHVVDQNVVVITRNKLDFISLTDIARHKNPSEPKDVVKNWMRSKTTIEFLGLWEKIHNPDFKGVEFDSLLYQAGGNAFVLSPSKWIEMTNAVGILVSSGKNGGTYAHKDIAFEFASWISSEFKLYLIVEFQRLKNEESQRSNLEWNLNRTLAKVNYRIHTDAIKENLIPPVLSVVQVSQVYADEADILNVALFGLTARQWRESNSGKEGNIRDYAGIEQLLVLANLENMNAEFIHMGLVQGERLKRLNAIAIRQMKTLLTTNTKALENELR